MDEAERCSRIGLIYQGKLLIADRPSAVKAQMEGAVLELRLEDYQKGIKMLEGIGSFRSLVLSGDKIHVLVDDPQEGERIIREVLKAQGMEVLGLIAVRPTLEDAFVSMVQGRKK